MKPSKEENILMDIFKNPYGRSLSTLENVWSKHLEGKRVTWQLSSFCTKRQYPGKMTTVQTTEREIATTSSRKQNNIEQSLQNY